MKHLYFGICRIFMYSVSVFMEKKTSFLCIKVSPVMFFCAPWPQFLGVRLYWFSPMLTNFLLYKQAWVLLFFHTPGRSQPTNHDPYCHIRKVLCHYKQKIRTWTRLGQIRPRLVLQHCGHYIKKHISLMNAATEGNLGTVRSVPDKYWSLNSLQLLHMIPNQSVTCMWLAYTTSMAEPISSFT